MRFAVPNSISRLAEGLLYNWGVNYNLHTNQSKQVGKKRYASLSKLLFCTQLGTGDGHNSSND